MKRTNLRRMVTPIFLTFCLSLVFLPIANADSDSISVNQSIGDGKDGRRFGKWQYKPKEVPIDSIEVTMRKEKGQNDTYVNLRLGNNHTLEGGRRVFVNSTNPEKARWTANGKLPKGNPLILNAYNGEVYIESVTINYADNKIRQPRNPRNPSA